MSATLRIDGATRLYAIVGDPIVQVRSPLVFTERFAERGANAVLLPVRIAPERFDDVFAALLAIGNLDGVLVTVPFKPRALRFADRLGATAQCIGALNALRREDDGSWSGDMFDGVGFVRAAERKGQRIRDRRVALLGAGGAGSAIACALAEAGAATIDVIDPAPGRADALAGKLRAAFPDCRFAAATSVASDADLIVNASTVGMRPGDGMPAPLGPLPPGTLVGDVILSEEPTAMLRHAERCGCAWVSGRDMHAGQSDAIVAFFAPVLERAGGRPAAS
ncbi:MAG: shikimate dehydrogenase [Betaproteobacteria bacterium]|nr:MAG: shikimate dehydrogenase [Betaproteobacteria bacterium]